MLEYIILFVLTEPVANKQVIGKTYKKDAKVVLEYLETFNNDAIHQLQKELETHG